MWRLLARWCAFCMLLKLGLANQRVKKSHERRLFEYLVRSYDPGSRPVMNAQHTVPVNFSISLNKVHDLVEKNQTLITHVWIFEEWRDEILTWNPKKFGGLSTIAIPTRLVWLPDIYIFNNADKGSQGFIASNDSHLMAHHNGRLTWTIPIIIKSSCTVDVRYFPFDNQHCFVKFGSWIYEESQLDLRLKDNVVDLSPPFSENTELELTSANLTREIVRYDVLPGRYPQITMHINIKRRPVFYAYTVIAPTLILCILTLFSFLLPCDNGDKVGIGLTVFLSLYLLQLAIAENMPEANTLPLIGLFLTLVMTLNAISLVFATLVINIKKKGDRLNCPSVPGFVLKICKKVLAKVTCTPFLNFYDFYGLCESESQAARETLPLPARHDTIKKSHVILSASSSTEGVATLRPRTKLKSDGNSSLKKRLKQKVEEEARKAAIEEMQRNPPRDPKYEWFFVAEVLDKSLFLIFLVVMVLTIAMSLIVVPWIHRND